MVDNPYAANRERYTNYDARHSGVKKYNIDVVGRIGNLIMEDTGDYRFSNLFKKAKVPTSWIVPGVVRDVDITQQNRILGSQVDIRGVAVSAGNHWLNTYGLLSHADKEPIPFPLTPDKNNIPALQRQPIRIGYKSYMDVQTIGSYSEGYIQMIPYYYHLNLSNGTIKPVDIYMSVNRKYVPINLFGVAQPGWDPSVVYNNVVTLSWDDEYQRRNYSDAERARTEQIASAFKTYDAYGNEINLITPFGKNYAYGNNQLMQLTSRNRTFIGTSMVNGRYNANPGNVFNDLLFGLQAQRWHFTTGLPSSAVAVEKGREPTETNIKALRNNTSVLLMTLDIKAVGDTYILQYKGSEVNGPVTIAGKLFDLSSLPYPVVSVISGNKSASEDLEITGTH